MNGQGNWAAPSLVTGTLTAGTSLTQNPITANTQVTQAHGLGATPHIVIGYLENLTTEYGYAAGDRYYLGAGYHDANFAVSQNGVGFNANATNLVGLVGNTAFYIQSKTDSTMGNSITFANWKFVVDCWKVN